MPSSRIAEAFVEQRIEAALQDFLVAVRRAAGTCSSRARARAGSRWLQDRRCARDCPSRNDSSPCRSSVRGARRRAARSPPGSTSDPAGYCDGVRLVHVDADVDARHVEHGEDAHRHAPLLQRRIDLPRRRAFQHHALRLARIAFHHAIADEAVADLREHRRLAQRLGEIHDRADPSRRGLRRCARLRAAASRSPARRSACR